MTSWIGTWWTLAPAGAATGTARMSTAPMAETGVPSPAADDGLSAAMAQTGVRASAEASGSTLRRVDGNREVARPAFTVERRRVPRNDGAALADAGNGDEVGEPWWAKPIQRPRQG